MFSFSLQIIAWSELLLLLEGECVHLPAPKTHFRQDIQLDKDTPVFCTSSKPIQLIRGGITDERENEMMRVRWRHFTLHSQIPLDQQTQLRPCARCFSTFLLRDN